MTTAADGKPSYFFFETNAFDDNFDQIAKNTDKTMEEVGEKVKNCFSHSNSLSSSVDVSLYPSKQTSKGSFWGSKSTCQSMISTTEGCSKTLKEAARVGLPEMRAVPVYNTAGVLQKITYQPTGNIVKWKD